MSDNRANVNNSTKPLSTNEESKEWEIVGDLEEATPVADQEAKLRTNSRVPTTNHLGTTTTAGGGQQDAPPATTTTTTGGRKHFVVGEYDIAVPTNKVPLLGVMASSGVVFIAVLVKNLIESRQSYGRYGIALSVVSFVVAFVSLIMPLKCTFVINLFNYFLFAWNFVGACIFTFNGGPFESTGNGYFALWSSVVFSAIAADPPGTFTSRPLLSKMNSILDFGAGAIVVLISLALALHEDSDGYKGEIIYAMLTTCISICAVFMFSLSYMRRGTRGCMESQILIVLSIMWIIGACAVTFSGPFLVTGNGYFASWVTAILSVKAASYSWEHRNDDE
jgi:hypothetical protein